MAAARTQLRDGLAMSIHTVNQIRIVSDRSKERLNRFLTRKKFAEFQGKQKPSLVAFESCETAHYLARAATWYVHEAHVIPAKAVALSRQGHKTDSNDTPAVAEAARWLKPKRRTGLVASPSPSRGC